VNDSLDEDKLLPEVMIRHWVLVQHDMLVFQAEEKTIQLEAMAILFVGVELEAGAEWVFVCNIYVESLRGEDSIAHLGDGKCRGEGSTRGDEDSTRGDDDSRGDGDFEGGGGTRRVVGIGVRVYVMYVGSPRGEDSALHRGDER